jgi:MFS family permease
LLFGGFGSLLGGFSSRLLSRRAIAFCGFAATAVFFFAFTRIQAVVPAMGLMGLASFSSDLSLPISWDTCVEIGGAYTATVAAAMNMLGNLGGFFAPVVGGVILQRLGTGPSGWNLLIDTMAGAAAVSAACWLYLDPESARLEREKQMNATSMMNSDPIVP